MGFKPSENLSEQLAADIGEKIICNKLAPGERILEARLAEEMGVSRSPVREALRILEKQKLVELIPRKGARVTPITTAHIKWFYDIFEKLYGLAARKSVENADERDHQRLRKALHKLETAALASDVEAYYNAIFEFAAVGLKASGNPVLTTILLDLWPTNRRIQYASLSPRVADLPNNVRFFQKMYHYFAAGQAIELVDVVTSYIRNEKKFALRLISKIDPGKPTLCDESPQAGHNGGTD